MLGLGVITSTVSAVGKFFTNRQTIKAAEKERKDEIKSQELTAKIEKIKNGQLADIEMDTNARSNAGFMDDISFYLFLLPVPLAFIPSMVPHITKGFEALEAMPEYYKYALGLMLVSVWGYRRLVIPLVEVIVKKWVSKLS